MNNNLKYNELREKYPTFIYHGYNIDIDENSIIITYDFEISNLSTFNPKIIFEKSEIYNQLKRSGFEQKIDIEDEVLRNIVFNIGMVEVISYLKLTCCSNLIVKCGYLDDIQKEWFKKLYLNGLGEFFYINNIDAHKENFINIESTGCNKSFCSTKELKGNIIPVGGGKDSNVTMEILSKENGLNTALIVNPRGASLESVKTAGYEKNLISVTRILDKKMLDLNSKGFLNGHTPFSAMLAFLCTLAAYMCRKEYIVLSNESSANQGNVVGLDVNHQYSKSIEFENDFIKYEKNYLKTNTNYFSILRPLTEIQIAKLFSKYKKYHKIFKSCNVGSKQDIWCQNCSKCLFVYIIISPFLPKEEVDLIFGKDLLDDNNLKGIFIELIGKGENKPFDCVGTYEEICYALAKNIKKTITNKENMSCLLKWYYEDEFSSNIQKIDELIEKSKSLEFGYILDNNLPEKFNTLLKETLGGF